MADIVKKVGIIREKGYLYFIDSEGNIARSEMSRGKTRKKGSQKVHETHIQREPGYLYYITKEGDVARTKMSRGRN